MPTAYIYVRCSHVESVETGYGLTAQEELASRYYELMRVRDPKLAEIPLHDKVMVDAAVSAYKRTTADFAKRPAGRELIEMLKPGDQIIFARLDRSFRNVRECLKWVDRWRSQGIGVHFADMQIDLDTAMGMFMLQIMAAISEWHSSYISERTTEGVRISQMKYGQGKLPRRWKRIKSEGKTIGYRIPKDLLLAMRYVVWQRHTLGLRYIEIAKNWDRCACKRSGRKFRTCPSMWQIWHDGGVQKMIRQALYLWPDRWPHLAYCNPRKRKVTMPKGFIIKAVDDGKMFVPPEPPNHLYQPRRNKRRVVAAQ